MSVLSQKKVFTTPEDFLEAFNNIINQYSNKGSEQTLIELCNLCEMMSAKIESREFENFSKKTTFTESIENELAELLMNLTQDQFNTSLQNRNRLFNIFIENILFHCLENPLPKKHSKSHLSLRLLEKNSIKKLDQRYYYNNEEVTFIPLNEFKFDDDKIGIIDERISLLMNIKHVGICNVYGKFKTIKEEFLVVSKYETNFEEYLSTVSDFNLKLIIIKDIVSLCWFLQSKGIQNYKINTSSFFFEKYTNSIQIKYFNFFNKEFIYEESISPISPMSNKKLIKMISKIASVSALAGNQAIEYSDVLEKSKIKINKAEEVLQMLITWMNKQAIPNIEYLKNIFEVLENLLLDR
ncbi:hypothetical protein SteCoe_29878 [Stentor coeruleus]|uniref:Protein kinase domain-containing protein n=1 Tax=Stentor coeruleus TaxID=5963 RepID=A0A1R2B4Y3_9CILI|nr:hypothetical protein SteCoe_29878 [Stentor coeruleus]